MTDELGRDVTISMLAHSVLCDEEPTPEELVELLLPLKQFKLEWLGEFLLNIRLGIRWHGLAAQPRMGKIVPHPLIEGALAMRVYVRQDNKLGIVEFALKKGGFQDISRWKSPKMGWRLRFTVTPEIMARYGTVTPEPS